jgi:hypothetical protein
MIDGCLPVEEVLRLADEFAGSEEDRSTEPRSHHFRSCPRCRGILLSYREFRGQVDRGPQPGEEMAVSRLDAFLRSQVASASIPESSTDQGARRERVGPREWRWAFPFRLAIPALGTAAILIGSFLFLRDDASWIPGRRSVLREVTPLSQNPEIALEKPRRVAGGAVEFRWRAGAPVDSYRIRFLDAGFREIARLEAGVATSITVPVARWDELREAGAIYWQAQGIVMGDPVVDSAPTLIPDSISRAVPR